MQTLKLFATDLDGTVLIDHGPEGCHATPRLKAALRGLQAEGVTVCLASGRMHESMRSIGDEMGVQGPIISYNGALVRDADDRVMLSKTLDPDLAMEISALAEERNLPMNFYSGGVLYARRIQPWWDLYQGRTSSPMIAVESHRGLAGTAPYKLLIYSEPKLIRALRQELEPRFSSRCHLMITADEYLEFVPLGVDKGHALALVAASLGVESGQVAAAGDGWNDVGMIQWAGTGIAIASGRADVRERADYIVDGPEQDGLARFIEERYLLAAGRADG